MLLAAVRNYVGLVSHGKTALVVFLYAAGNVEKQNLSLFIQAFWSVYPRWNLWILSPQSEQAGFCVIFISARTLKKPWFAYICCWLVCLQHMLKFVSSHSPKWTS